jgi:hypothetical protein
VAFRFKVLRDIAKLWQGAASLAIDCDKSPTGSMQSRIPLLYMDRNWAVAVSPPTSVMTASQEMNLILTGFTTQMDARHSMILI